jgi:hypothetical protein
MVTSPLRERLLNGILSRRDSNITSSFAETTKTTAYARMESTKVHPFRFVPAGFSALGGIGPCADWLVRDIVGKTVSAQATAKSYPTKVHRFRTKLSTLILTHHTEVCNVQNLIAGTSPATLAEVSALPQVHLDDDLPSPLDAELYAHAEPEEEVQGEDPLSPFPLPLPLPYFPPLSTGDDSIQEHGDSNPLPSARNWIDSLPQLPEALPVEMMQSAEEVAEYWGDLLSFQSMEDDDLMWAREMESDEGEGEGDAEGEGREFAEEEAPRGADFDSAHEGD